MGKYLLQGPARIGFESLPEQPKEKFGEQCTVDLTEVHRANKLLETCGLFSFSKIEQQGNLLCLGDLFNSANIERQYDPITETLTLTIDALPYPSPYTSLIEYVIPLQGVKTLKVEVKQRKIIEGLRELVENELESAGKGENTARTFNTIRTAIELAQSLRYFPKEDLSMMLKRYEETIGFIQFPESKERVA